LEQPPSTFYAGLIAEIDEMGWDRLIWLCTNLSALHVRINDAAGEDFMPAVSTRPCHFSTDSKSQRKKLWLGICPKICCQWDALLGAAQVGSIVSKCSCQLATQKLHR